MSKRSKKQAKRTRRRWKTSSIITWATLGGLGAAILVLGFFAFAGGEDQPRRPTRQEPVVTDEPRVTVEVRDNWFEPDELTVRPGTEITWTLEGNAAHDVTAYEGAFKSGTLGSGDEYVLTFDEPGTYEYYCTLHHSMTGSIIVQQAE